jgi:hypothetical protein
VRSLVTAAKVVAVILERAVTDATHIEPSGLDSHQRKVAARGIGIVHLECGFCAELVDIEQRQGQPVLCHEPLHQDRIMAADGDREMVKDRVGGICLGSLHRMDGREKLLGGAPRKVLFEFPRQMRILLGARDGLIERNGEQKQKCGIDRDGHLACLDAVELQKCGEVLVEFSDAGSVVGILAQGQRVLPFRDCRQHGSGVAAIEHNGLDPTAAQAESDHEVVHGHNTAISEKRGGESITVACASAGRRGSAVRRAVSSRSR